MSPAGKRSVLIVGVAAVVGFVVAAVVMLSGGGSAPTPSSAAEIGSTTTEAVSAPDPKSAAEDFLGAFAAGDADQAAQLTDDPQATSAALRAAWQALSPRQVVTSLGKVGPVTGNTAPAAYVVRWVLGAGGHVWSYQDTLDVVRTNGTWRVHWTPAVLVPTLRAGQQLALVTDTPRQTAVVDRDGRPLVLTDISGPRMVDQTSFPSVREALVGQVSAVPPVFAVEQVDAGGHVLRVLFGTTGSRVSPLKSTLSTAVQSAAQSVVNGYTAGPAVIVAIQPSDGGLLAVAHNDQSTTSPFSGLYAPGSTFKIATATAVLEAGIATTNTTVSCPLTEQINTRTISNEGFALGTTTMREAFAKSCNTTFGQLASRLRPNGLVNAADQFGLNADFAIPGLNTQTGKVVPATDSDQQVEDGIGQGAVQVSPFGEALMAATVAEGHAVTPRLWQDKNTAVLTGYSAPSPAVLASLRTMMRAVVVDGTATGLAHSGLVYGKTGTAQFGADPGADAHGWFVGYRGNVAFAVFLENSNDSVPAVALAARFLAKIG